VQAHGPFDGHGQHAERILLPHLGLVGEGQGVEVVDAADVARSDPVELRTPERRVHAREAFDRTAEAFGLEPAPLRRVHRLQFGLQDHD